MLFGVYLNISDGIAITIANKTWQKLLTSVLGNDILGLQIKLGKGIALWKEKKF